MRKSNYTFTETIYNIWCLMGTKLFYKKARLIRTPITIRGKKYIDFGYKLTTGKNCQFEVNGTHNEACLVFGKKDNIGNNVRIQCVDKITLGDNVLIGSRVTIIDHSHGKYRDDNQDSPELPPNERELYSNPIHIYDNVWIGDGAVIQSGVTVGFGSIISANSVVTKNVPDRVIVAGAPAKIIKKYDESMHKWVRV